MTETHTDHPTQASETLSDAQRTIALVDDDRNILTTLSIALQAEGFATRVYSDGEAALGALLQNPPDLAVFVAQDPPTIFGGLVLYVRSRTTRDGVCGSRIAWSTHDFIGTASA